MTFQAYIDNIRAKTGKSPEQIKTHAEKAGAFRPDMTATELVAWLKKECDLGHGHSMGDLGCVQRQGLGRRTKSQEMSSLDSIKGSCNETSAPNFVQFFCHGPRCGFNLAREWG
jgi:hypothetical protein